MEMTNELLALKDDYRFARMLNDKSGMRRIEKRTDGLYGQDGLDFIQGIY